MWIGGAFAAPANASVRLDISGETARQTVISEGGRTLPAGYQGHAAVAASAIGAFGDTGEDVLVRDGARAGDFGAPQVIVMEIAPERAHLAWPKIASDGGGNLVVGFVAAREHVEGNGVIGYADRVDVL